MSPLTEADRYLLKQIRRGSAEGWSQLVERYQGRLLAFARNRLKRSAEAEDLVQETFVSFLKTLAQFREHASLETYLFVILRRKICDYYRGRSMNVCLLQDTGSVASDSEDQTADLLDQIAAPDPTASWYARRNEESDAMRAALSKALHHLIDGFKKSLNFRDLQIVEMLFYCRLPNRDIARIANVSKNQVGLIKWRNLKQIREAVTKTLRTTFLDGGPSGESTWSAADLTDNVLCEIWQDERLSCLKRSTIGAYLLGTVDPAWAEYVGFHLNRLGCRFCRANLNDLQEQTSTDDTDTLQQRILQSTVGFLLKP